MGMEMVRERLRWNVVKVESFILKLLVKYLISTVLLELEGCLLIGLIPAGSPRFEKHKVVRLYKAEDHRTANSRFPLLGPILPQFYLNSEQSNYSLQ